MTEQPFSLIPFPDPKIPDITIRGRIVRQNSFLTIHYALEGKLEDILLASLSATPSRKDELWKSTCFEFFLAAKDLAPYWEFNMSSSGDWNVYRMESYRRIGFQEETRILRLPFDVQKNANGLSIVAAIDLSPIVALEQDLEMGITAVVRATDTSETYWALVHPAAQADFHVRESFILELEG